MEFNSESLQSFYQSSLDVLPSLLKGLLFIIVIIIAYKLVLYLCKKLLNFIKIDALNQKIENVEIIDGKTVKVNLRKIIMNVVKVLLVLIILIIFADYFKLDTLSVQISNLLSYLPDLFFAVLIFSGGIYLASRANKAAQGFFKSIDAGGSKAVGMIIFWLIAIFATITALNQARIDTSIISDNLTTIIGAVLVTLVIAIGLGSRDIVYRLILGFYTKKNLEIGMKIQIGDTIGTIVAISNITLVLETENNQKIVYPIKTINDNEIKIL